MNKMVLFLLCLFSAVHASGSDAFAPFKKFSGVYHIYGGGLGDPVAPSPQDRKIMFSISGRAAKDIFDAIGPDKKDICSQQSRTRVRSKDDEKLSCRRSEKGEYDCNFGFDLRSGKSLGGVIC